MKVYENDGKHKMDRFHLACMANRADIAEWLRKQYGVLPYSISNTFVEACRRGFVEVAYLIMKISKSKGAKKRDLLIRGFRSACESNHMSMAKAIIDLDVKFNIYPENYINILCIVIANGNIEMAKWLIELSKKGYGKNDDLTAPFHIACEIGRIDIVKWMVELTEIGYKISSDLNGPFRLACENGCIDVAEYVLKLSFTDTFKPLSINYRSFASAVDGGKKMAQWYVNLGSPGNILEYENINTLKARSFAFKKIINYTHDYHMIKWLIELDLLSDERIDIHIGEEKLFKHCCKKNDIELAKYLIKVSEDSYGKIDIHHDNDSAFYNACKYGNLDIAKWLLELGNSTYGPINIRIDNELFSSICKKGNNDMMVFLIELCQQTNWFEKNCDKEIIEILFNFYLQKSKPKEVLNLLINQIIAI